MQARRSVAVAGAAVAVAFATTLGLGTSFGLFAAAQPGSPAGHLGAQHTTEAHDDQSRPVAADD